MVKSDKIDLRYKIKSTSEILKTESPAEIARAILNGFNPPNIPQRSLESKVRRLIAKKVDGEWRLEDKPRSGRPRTILTPKGLGRIKKMKDRSCRKVQSYTEGSPALTISKSTAHRGKKEVKLKFFK